MSCKRSLEWISAAGGPYGIRTRLFRLKIGRSPRPFSAHSDNLSSGMPLAFKGLDPVVEKCRSTLPCPWVVTRHLAWAGPRASLHRNDAGAQPCQASARELVPVSCVSERPPQISLAAIGRNTQKLARSTSRRVAVLLAAFRLMGQDRRIREVADPYDDTQAGTGILAQRTVEVAQLLSPTKWKRTHDGAKACCPCHDDNDPASTYQRADDKLIVFARHASMPASRSILDELQARGIRLFRDERRAPTNSGQTKPRTPREAGCKPLRY